MMYDRKQIFILWKRVFQTDVPEHDLYVLPAINHIMMCSPALKRKDLQGRAAEIVLKLYACLPLSARFRHICPSDFLPSVTLNTVLPILNHHPKWWRKKTIIVFSALSMLAVHAVCFDQTRVSFFDLDNYKRSSLIDMFVASQSGIMNNTTECRVCIDHFLMLKADYELASSQIERGDLNRKGFPQTQPMIDSPVLRRAGVCLLTGQPMKHPVICEDGYTYEESSIRAFLSNNDQSPVTGQLLRHGDKQPIIYPNYVILQLKQACLIA